MNEVSPIRTFFDPLPVDRRLPADQLPPYAFYDDHLVEAINVARACERPLLLLGEPGLGKSSVARGIADTIPRWTARGLKTVVTSRSVAEDLLFRFDALRRFSDAQARQEVGSELAYSKPGVMWLATAPRDAEGTFEASNLDASQIAELGNAAGRVVLIDEIDKGDLAFANDLLDLFDDRREGFRIDRFSKTVSWDGTPFLPVITSNSESELPDAFTRRCIAHELLAPTKEQCVDIGLVHQKRRKAEGATRSALDLESVEKLCDAWKVEGDYDNVNTAEFIDTLDAVLAFLDAARESAGSSPFDLVGLSQKIEGIVKERRRQTSIR
ncbi:MAG: AAA family ATPase [Pseudomonadota bacterium]